MCEDIYSIIFQMIKTKNQSEWLKDILKMT